MILRFVFIFLALFFLSSCSSNLDKNNNISDNEEFSSPETQYTEAMMLFDNQQYDLATQKFKNIERIYPLSNEAIQSQIMQGFIGYIFRIYLIMY